MEWDAEQEEKAVQIVEKQRLTIVDHDKRREFHEKAGHFWDLFYGKQYVYLVGVLGLVGW